jgi:PIN domain nuclease of toxin-antitoxin system
MGGAEVILLDTHAWVWFVSEPTKLSKKAQASIDQALRKNEILISCISAWEVALLVSKERLKLTMDVSEWILASEKLPFVRFIPIDNRIAVRAVSLPPALHNDPADRIIIATAVSYGAQVITMDRKIQGFPHIQSIW